MDENSIHINNKILDNDLIYHHIIKQTSNISLLFFNSIYNIQLSIYLFIKFFLFKLT